jgi:uncharacterized damage-inducible protein DinB
MNSYLAQAQNNHWSNRRLFSACFALSHDEYVAKRTSFFPSIEKTLLHILEVDGFYLEGDRQRRAMDEVSSPFAQAIDRLYPDR